MRGHDFCTLLVQLGRRCRVVELLLRLASLNLLSRTALRCSTSQDSRVKTSGSSFSGDVGGVDDDDNDRMSLLVTCNDVDFAPS